MYAATQKFRVIAISKEIRIASSNQIKVDKATNFAIIKSNNYKFPLRIVLSPRNIFETWKNDVKEMLKDVFSIVIIRVRVAQLLSYV